MFALWMVWIAVTGAYFPDAWYPSALAAVTLLAVTIAGRRQVLPRSSAGRWAIGAFGGLVALSYLSIVWAGSPGSALDASNQLLLYLALAWVLSILPWTPRSLTVLLAAWSVGVAVYCIVGLAQAVGASNLNPFFEELRYSTPLDYPNATSALAAMGALPSLVLSGRTALPSWLRALLLSVTVFLIEFALLPQSRGAAVALALTLALVFALGAQRLQLVVRLAVVGGALAFSVPRTVAVDQAANAGRPVGALLDHAAAVMLATSCAAFLLGLALAYVAGRAPKTLPTWPRPGRRLWIALSVVMVLVLAAGAAAAGPSVGHRARSVWRAVIGDAPAGTTHLLSTTVEERPDVYRAAIRLFESAPVAGVGAGNFGRRYDALRHVQKHSQYTHDLVLRVLSENGVIGLLFFLAVAASLSAGLLRVGRTLGPLGRGCALAGFAVTTYFVLHASLDWLDEYPVLAAPALGLPLAAVSMQDVDRREPRAGHVQRRRSVWHFRTAPFFKPVLLVAAWLGAVVLLGGPYLSIRYAERALATFRSRPAAAYNDLRRARAVDPLSSNPWLTEGTIAVRLGDDSRARAAFTRAIGIEDGWYPRVQLAFLYAHARRFDTALEELNRAAELDSSDPLISQAQALISRRAPVDPIAADRLFLQGVPAQLYRVQNIK